MDRIEQAQITVRERMAQEIATAYEGMSEEESFKHQLRYWARGVSTHNTITNRHTPDFACCQDKFKFSLDKRRKFMRAYKENDGRTLRKLIRYARVMMAHNRIDLDHV